MTTDFHPERRSDDLPGAERLLSLSEVPGARGTRLVLLIASLLAGLVIALLTVYLAGKWEPIGQGQR